MTGLETYYGEVQRFPINLKEKYILFIEDHEMFRGVDYVSAMLSHIEQFCKDNNKQIWKMRLVVYKCY